MKHEETLTANLQAQRDSEKNDDPKIYDPSRAAKPKYVSENCRLNLLSGR